MYNVILNTVSNKKLPNKIHLALKTPDEGTYTTFYLSKIHLFLFLFVFATDLKQLLSLMAIPYLLPPASIKRNNVMVRQSLIEVASSFLPHFEVRKTYLLLLLNISFFYEPNIKA